MNYNFKNSSSLLRLPKEVFFCKECVISNQRPSAVVEFKNTGKEKKPTIFFNENGICSACQYKEIKNTKIDWKERERELESLCDRYRSRNGSYDVVVPGSGGKDSVFVSHKLKYVYNMNPLTVTWSPHSYTEVGWKNFQSWINGGFDNFLHTPNGQVHKLLTKIAFTTLCHPFQPFIFGQKFLAPKIAMLHDVKLVFFGENEAEYGNPIADNSSSKRDYEYFSASNEALTL